MRTDERRGDRGEPRLTASVYDSLTEVPAGRWGSDSEALGFAMSRKWLSFTEGSLGSEASYIVVTDRGRSVVNLVCYRVEDGIFGLFDPIDLVQSEARWNAVRGRLAPSEIAAARRLAASVPRTDVFPVAMCVSPFSYEAGLWVASCLSQASVDAALGAAVEAFEATAVQWGAPSRVMLYDSDRRVDSAIDARGYVSSALAAQATLAIPGSFEEFLLRAGGVRRRSIRRELRALQEIATVQRGGAELLAEDFPEVFARTQARYGHTPDPELERAVLQKYVDAFGDSFRVLRARGAGRVAYVAGLQHGAGLYPKWWAVDGNWPKRAAPYFVLGYYELLRWCIDLGLSFISYGPESYAAKLARGCRLRRLTGHFAFGGAGPELIQAYRTYGEALDTELAGDGWHESQCDPYLYDAEDGGQR